MENQQHFSARSLLKKAVSVTLASTMLLGMITIGNVFGTSKAYAAEKWSEGDYDLSTKDDGTIRIDHYNGTAADVCIPVQHILHREDRCSRKQKQNFRNQTVRLSSGSRRDS